MPYQPGESGNPSGRPIGARNRATLLMEKLWLAEGRAMLRAICRKSVRDPEYAALFCQHILPRFMPLARSHPVEFQLSDPASATAILADVARAVAAGELAPEEAERIGTIAKTRMEAIDLAQMNSTLRRLEARHAGIGDDDMAADRPSRSGNGSELS